MRWEKDELMTVPEIADLLRLNRQTIYNWIDAGTLPHVQAGRRVRVWRADLLAFAREERDRQAPTGRADTDDLGRRHRDAGHTRPAPPVLRRRPRVGWRTSP
jgi:excisionase family DNA binding protein